MSLSASLATWTARAMPKIPRMAELRRRVALALKANCHTRANLQLALLPRDEADKKPAMLEIPRNRGRRGAFCCGGFVAHVKVSDARSWISRMIEQQFNELGRVKESCPYQGESLCAAKYESGVHRCRVHPTESGGRSYPARDMSAVCPRPKTLEYPMFQ